MPNLSKNSFKDDINVTLDLLDKSGVDDAYYVNLTRDINIPVVRVIIPGLELFSVDSSRIGERLRPKDRIY
jgi:YcaO-like protein with predicted kinase domain